MRFLVLLAGLVALAAMMPLCIAGAPHLWGEWTSCSRTCGAGARVRTSQCNHPHNKCPTETEACNDQACDVNETSGVNVTSASPGANNTVGPSPSQGFNVTSATPIANDTGGPSPSEGFNVTSATPIANDTGGPSPSEATAGDITEGKEAVSTKTVEDVETDEFVGSGTMARIWTDELGNPTSQEHKELKNDCETKLKETYKNEDSVIATEVTKFTSGSVVMHFRVKTLRSRRASSSRLQSVFALSVQSGALKGLGITSFKLTMMTKVDEGSKIYSEGEGNSVDPWQFFLYGFGVMTVLAVIFVLIALIKIKLVPNTQDEPNKEDDDYGFELKFNFPGKERKTELENNNKVEKEDDGRKAFYY
ncbi:uncharacterized protein LOC116291800 [Actinia tenebrosa]|uniref:Uncharacterized protein LOC116291800 n=1 Tax=Actinia tenebrosa TaxID=6105 RepID=A0A6P8HGC7_ACTTE|nr:uncharacterized protein LOC116291800 [Actinia tenebrosa]XP_031554881.1 uncharacterized protein LOC116291800 [Actinia tenebrosa]